MKKMVNVIFIVLIISISILILSSCANNENGDNTIYSTFNVEFETYGGTKIDTLISDPKTGKVARPINPVKAGYTFVDWYNSAKFDTKFDFDKVITENVVIYALWQKTKYTILFDGNGSNSGGIEKVFVETDEVIKLPANNFVKNGYSFLGWSDSANGSVKTPNNGYYIVDVKQETVIILYAIWKANEYKITFDFQGGESNVQNVQATFDSDLPNLYDGKPIKNGYIFCGYYNEPNGKGEQYYDENMNAVKQYIHCGEMVLYANWLSTRTILTFYNNDVEGNTYNIECKIGDEVELPQCIFVKKGYEFVGWSTSIDGIEEIYLPMDKYIVSISNSKELYAIWRPITYKVEFLNNDEKVVQILTYDKEESLMLSPFIKKGHSLLGWSKNIDGELEFLNNENVLNLAKEQDSVIVLYSVWSVNTYEAILDKQKGYGGSDKTTALYGSAFEEIQVPKRDGYIFAGYSNNKEENGDLYIDSSGIGIKSFFLDENIRLFAVWIPKVNNIYFGGNGATSGTMKSVTTYTEENLILPINEYSRIGYEFVGWNTSANGNGTLYFENSEYIVPVSEEPITLYAQWKEKEVKIVLEPNSAEPEEIISLIGYSDSNIILSVEYEKPGYTLKGWATDNNDYKNMFLLGEQYYIAPTDENIILYAVWEIIQYTIEYKIENGTNFVNNPTTYTIEDDEIILGNPKRVGYTFNSWVEGNNIASGSTGNKVFTAVWDAIVYKIYYNLNGGFNSEKNPQQYTIEDEIQLENPIKSSNNFLGWDEGNIIHLGSIGNRTFTAVWDEEIYNIMYELDGGINGAGNPTKYTHDSETIILNAPTKLGYIFIGWYDSSKNTINNIIENGSQGDKTFTAQWEAENYGIDYILDGGINNVANPVTYTIEDYIILENPVKPGFVFIGWKEGDLIETGSTGNKTFTAQWKKDAYSIVYILGEGAINHPDNPTSYTVDSEDIVINEPSRFGYEFAGWKEGSDIDIPHGSTGDKYLEAEWSAIIYSITYQLNGQNIVNNNPLNYTIEDEIELISPSYPGHKFVNWTNNDGVVVTIINKGTTDDLTLIANWRKADYNIIYDLGIGTDIVINNNPTIFTDEDEFDLLPLEMEGYNFIGWTDESGKYITKISKGTTGDLTLTANWELIEYTVTYLIDDEIGIVENINPTIITIEDEVILKPLDIDGYTFLGWFDEQGNKIDKINKGSTKNIVLQAVFEKY